MTTAKDDLRERVTNRIAAGFLNLDQMGEIADAILSAILETHVIVPMEPTQHQMREGQRAIGELSLQHEVGRTPHRDIASISYTAMLSAAPKVSQ